MIDPTKIQYDVGDITREIQGEGVAFLKIDAAKVRQRHDGDPAAERSQWSAPKTWEILERGDSVAVLLHNLEEDAIILTRQFRAPLLNRINATPAQKSAVIIEAIAGVVQPGERPAETAMREVLEETGYVPIPPPGAAEGGGDGEGPLEKIAAFFPSPGGCSERITVFYGAVDNACRAEAGGGLADGGELIEVLTLPNQTFFDMVASGEIIDAKLLVGFAAYRDRVEQHRARNARGVSFQLRGVDTPFQIRLRLGDIAQVDDVDLWVNSENTLMEMDQFVGRSVSARIRSLGAWIDASGGSVRKDFVNEALRRKVHRLGKLSVGDVIETGPGRLCEKNVRSVLHVASVEGRIGVPVQGALEDVRRAAAAVLTCAHDKNRGWTARFQKPFTSVLLPMIGAGNAGLGLQDVFPELVEAVAAFAKAHPETKIRDVNLSIFKDKDFDWAVSHLMNMRSDFARATPTPA